ncbi:uncharacterized protein [Onthophagus taurus]|uniref:uncharacterized protein isoform X3 n=1 Tax=Onthophagus taurus TaxID=166361 RepID=UPI000C1FDF46|nr:uncharacterized protein LOC111428275 isoform X2 [Onthophagus taurus]
MGTKQIVIFKAGETALSTESEGSSQDSIQSLLNDTDSELSDLSHLDAPNESLYMIGGVLIAMVLVGLIIILLAVTINKLRKREEHGNSVHPADVVLQQTTTNSNNGTTISLNNNNNVQINQINQNNHQPTTDPFVRWQFPPPEPKPTYNQDQDSLVQNLPRDRPGFVTGFRKNLGGKWRRLVKKKPTTEVYTIPAELKPQLKQIYVY